MIMHFREVRSVRCVRELQGDVMVLNLSGKLLGGEDHDLIKSEVRAVLDEGIPDIVLDFADVPWLSSNGVGVLVSAHTTVQRHSGQLKLCNLKERDMSVLEVTRLLPVFDIHATQQEAVASFGRDVDEARGG
jgi:anti-anti-sigma factor